ncbi:PREDICTED: uncharacterized protein LOC107066892 [Polistes dominula]|uniref:Uncharacterized protein LOC107066892 n=1 Tax=Polistes dominula TaxID=743375 RepID=A0ABM1IB21_POLDO|nr:PREDICTED: uncharacterized protein LOC107066892 [Polistes dominula]
MGQVMGEMPSTLDGLKEERDRVLHWSGEILAKVSDNIQNEDTFLMDYTDEKVDEKVKGWFDANMGKINETWSKIPNINEDCKNSILDKIEKLKQEFSSKVRKEYESAYSDIKKFTKKVDKFGSEERKIHESIQNVENESGGDVGKFQKKFGPLRVKVFKNLEIGEKFMFEDKRLKDSFTKRVFDVDQKLKAECAKKFDKFVKEAEKCGAK